MQANPTVLTASISDLSEYTRVIRLGSLRVRIRPGTPIGPFWAACACALKLRRFHLAAQTTQGDFKAEARDETEAEAKATALAPCPSELRWQRVRFFV